MISGLARQTYIKLIDCYRKDAKIDKLWVVQGWNQPNFKSVDGLTYYLYHGKRPGEFCMPYQLFIEDEIPY